MRTVLLDSCSILLNRKVYKISIIGTLLHVKLAQSGHEQAVGRPNRTRRLYLRSQEGAPKGGGGHKVRRRTRPNHYG